MGLDEYSRKLHKLSVLESGRNAPLDAINFFETKIASLSSSEVLSLRDGGLREKCKELEGKPENEKKARSKGHTDADWSRIICRILTETGAGDDEDDTLHYDAKGESAAYARLCRKLGLGASNFGLLCSVMHLGQLCIGQFSDVYYEKLSNSPFKAKQEKTTVEQTEYTSVLRMLPKKENTSKSPVRAATMLLGATGSGKSLLIGLIKNALGTEEEEEDGNIGGGSSNIHQPKSLSEGLNVARSTTVATIVDNTTFAALRKKFNTAISERKQDFPRRKSIHYMSDETLSLMLNIAANPASKSRDSWLNVVEGGVIRVEYDNAENVKGRVTMSTLLGSQPNVMAKYTQELQDCGFLPKLLIVPLPPAQAVEKMSALGINSDDMCEVESTFEHKFAHGTLRREKARGSPNGMDVVLTRGAARTVHEYAEHVWPVELTNAIAVLSPPIEAYVARRLRQLPAYAAALAIGLQSTAAEPTKDGVLGLMNNGPIVVTSRYVRIAILLLEYSIKAFATIVLPELNWSDMTCLDSVKAMERSIPSLTAQKMIDTVTNENKREMKVLRQICKTKKTRGGTTLNIRKLATNSHVVAKDVRAILESLTSKGWLTENVTGTANPQSFNVRNITVTEMKKFLQATGKVPVPLEQDLLNWAGEEA